MFPSARSSAGPFSVLKLWCWEWRNYVLSQPAPFCTAEPKPPTDKRGLRLIYHVLNSACNSCNHSWKLDVPLPHVQNNTERWVLVVPSKLSDGKRDLPITQFTCLLFMVCVRTLSVTSLLIHSMEQSPSWKANSFSSSQEIPHILTNPKIHYLVYKCPLRSQINPIHVSPFHFLIIHLNIILSSMSAFSKWSVSLRLPHKNPVNTSPLLHICYMLRPSHSSRFGPLTIFVSGTDQ